MTQTNLTRSTTSASPMCRFHTQFHHPHRLTPQYSYQKCFLGETSTQHSTTNYYSDVEEKRRQQRTIEKRERKPEGRSMFCYLTPIKATAKETQFWSLFH